MATERRQNRRSVATGVPNADSTVVDGSGNACRSRVWVQLVFRMLRRLRKKLQRVVTNRCSVSMMFRSAPRRMVSKPWLLPQTQPKHKARSAKPAV